jgi:thiosulfate dehydrogenase [quinone] large subunit
MKESNTYSTLQVTTLVILRLMIGWHILYEGISKLLNPDWSSIGFLSESKWIFSGFANWIITNPGVLKTVDFLNTWGLIAIGAALMLGLFIRFAALAGTILLLIYYLNNPPLIGLEYTIPSEGSNIIVNKTLIEAIALFVLAVFPAHAVFGLEALITNMKSKKK